MDQKRSLESSRGDLTNANRREEVSETQTCDKIDLEHTGAWNRTAPGLKTSPAQTTLASSLSEADIPTRKTTLCAGIDQRGRYHGLRFDPIEDVGAVDLPGKQWICNECVDRIIAGARPKGLPDERFVTKGRPAKIRETRAAGAVNPKGNGNTGKARRYKRPAWSGR